MRNRSKPVLIALAATMLLSLAAGTAPARRFRVSERNFQIIWNSTLEGTKTDFSWMDSSRQTVTCPLSLLGTFTSATIVKTTGTNIGEIFAAATGTCSSGSATVLRETLPWEVSYASFSGRLPSEIEGIKINIARMAIRVENGLFRCLTTTTAAEPFVVILNRFALGGPNNTRAEESNTIGFEANCLGFSPERVSGIGLVRALNGNVVSVTLI